MDEQLPSSLQESILAVLAFDAGPFAAKVVNSVDGREYFDEPYQKFATAFLDYRRQYGKPVGPAHLDDVFGFELQSGDSSARVRRLLTDLSTLWESGVNSQYVAGRAGDHTRAQILKQAIMQAGEIYRMGGGADNIAEIEAVLHTALRHRVETLDSGKFLSDTSFQFLKRASAQFRTGIDVLDDRDIGPMVGDILLYIAPKNTGKSWFCVHMGKQGLMQHEKVVHISLEMSEDAVLGRYMQSLFSVAWKKEPYDVSELLLDAKKKAIGWKKEDPKPHPQLSFDQPDIKQVLRKKIGDWGIRFNNVVIKQFPGGWLTVPRLETYLDHLEAAEKFIPTVLIVDYPYLMKLDANNQRIDLGRTIVDLRGLCTKRGMSGIFPAQGQREAMKAKRVRSTHAAEDITQVWTSDTVLTYSQTIEGEYPLGLARLYVDHARERQKGFEMVITQAYAIGQYCTSSALHTAEYKEKMDAQEATSATNSSNPAVPNSAAGRPQVDEEANRRAARRRVGSNGSTPASRN